MIRRVSIVKIYYEYTHIETSFGSYTNINYFLREICRYPYCDCYNISIKSINIEIK